MQMNFWYTKAKSYSTQEKSKYSIEIIFFQIPIGDGDGQKTKVGSAYNNYINNVLCICKLILIFHPAPQKI